MATMSRKPFGWGSAYGREFLRQVEARDGRFARELDGLLGIEALHDARLRARALSCITGDGRDDPVAVARAADVVRRHEAAHADTPVGRGDECGSSVDFERADECLRGVLEDLLELAGIAAVAATLDRDTHAIAVHDAVHLRRRQEDRILLSFDAHEAEARAVGAHDAFGGAPMRRRRRRMRPAGMMFVVFAARGTVRAAF
jgi:hypothetical protein